MFISVNDPSIRFTGRWGEGAGTKKATAPGSYFEFAYKGKMAVMHFSMSLREPAPHLWISVDGSAKIESQVSSYVRIDAEDEGIHNVKVIFKSSVEGFHRWYSPLEGVVEFFGYEADAPATLCEDNRKIIEFVGDSITEGVLIDPTYTDGMHTRLLQDDSAATYAWLTAEKLNLRPVIMGYGSVGATKSGSGSVPMAAKAYPYNFDGSNITHKPDYILVNHGANDMNAECDLYIEKYKELLDVIRKNQPQAKIVSLSAFYGVHEDALCEAIKEYNKENSTDIGFISSKGWVPKEPLHPLRDGHKIISEKLTPLLKKELGL